MREIFFISIGLVLFLIFMPTPNRAIAWIKGFAGVLAIIIGFVYLFRTDDVTLGTF